MAGCSNCEFSMHKILVTGVAGFVSSHAIASTVGSSVATAISAIARTDRMAA